MTHSFLITSFSQATAETYNSIIYDDAKSLYSDIMKETIDEKKTFFSEIKLMKKHFIAKNRIIQQVDSNIPSCT